MAEYHAVMIDETGCEFGVTIEAHSREAAYAKLEEDYPESRVDQLEDEEQRETREQEIYAHAARCLDDPYYDIDMDGRW